MKRITLWVSLTIASGCGEPLILLQPVPVVFTPPEELYVCPELDPNQPEDSRELLAAFIKTGTSLETCRASLEAVKASLEEAEKIAQQMARRPDAPL